MHRSQYMPLLLASLTAASYASEYSQASVKTLSNAKFIAGLFWTTPKKSYRHCSATIVTDTHLLTSASCISESTLQSKYGAGNLTILAGSGDRFLAETETKTSGINWIFADGTTNLAVVQLEQPLELSSSIRPILVSTQTNLTGVSLEYYNSKELDITPIVPLEQGRPGECKRVMPGYSTKDVICTVPVASQDVRVEWAGGEPIIGYVRGSVAMRAALVGVTGSFYSNDSKALDGVGNDPDAYRMSGLARSQIKLIADLRNFPDTAISDPGPLQ